MKNVIKKIIDGTDIENIFLYVVNNIFKKGPTSLTDMEILSYLLIYQFDRFEYYKNSILNYMGLFYKRSIERTSLNEVIFGQYRKYINDTYKAHYTPVQASIIKGINRNQCFSFSAPTSTGKSFVFMNMINETKNDVIVIVPSRALINEYFIKLSNKIPDKSVNILTFIEKINTNFSNKNVFIVTPERCRDLFRNKNEFSIDIFFFDEAQLSSEASKRGLYFDSIVRRSQKAFPNSTFVFAHPFVKNPDSQIKKNNFDINKSGFNHYTQKNVGQIFLYSDDEWNFNFFGIEKKVMGIQSQRCFFDPIEQAIVNRGSVLFYVAKSKILDKRFLKDFNKYIKLCPELEQPEIEIYIDQLIEYTGGNIIETEDHFSQMILLLKRGIVIHHGSIPLQTRILIEEFTNKGFCRICFATSTLEQGINMPFDVVFLDRLESSKALSVKNLIGRAGRSTDEFKFDFGYVIVNSKSKMSGLRKIMLNDEVLDQVSLLEKPDSIDTDFNEFKDAILNNTFSDQYNLSIKDLDILTSKDLDTLILDILNKIFINGMILPLKEVSDDNESISKLFSNFTKLYSIYLGRDLSDGENNVINTAIRIILWRIHGRTFKNICWYRYSYASKAQEREGLKKGKMPIDHLTASFITGYNDLPDRTLNVFSLFPLGTKAVDVDYDLIMFDTYDYIDKLIGFRLSDVFYAIFYKYFERYKDDRAIKLAKFIKYGTDNDRYIWMLKYGLTFEDIEIFDKHIIDINSTQIFFNESIYEIPEVLRGPVKRYMN